jgi:hypothetical protein
VDSSPTQGSGRRKGPVSFQAEAKATSLHVPVAHEPFAIARAAGPTLETPRGSKKLSVAGPITWLVLGLVSIVLAVVLLSLILAVIGIALCLIAYLTGRVNRTERRLRADASGSVVQK